MGRRWVAIEREPSTIDEFARPRLARVVGGQDPGGITELASWTGGGGFHFVEVAPSMFEANGGLVFLADWMSNGVLAEATAAQLGFTYEADAPFSGRKGRTRLAVVDAGCCLWDRNRYGRSPCSARSETRLYVEENSSGTP
jgi:adenine-specific DNA-methyltransferase